MARKSKKLKQILISSMMLATFSLQTISVIAETNIGSVDPNAVKDDWQYSKKTKNICNTDEDSSTSDDADTPPSAAADGDWLTKGTKANKVAQVVFDYMTKEKGVSGAFAASMLANILGESRFIVNITEAENGQNYSGRGYGLFQFTPGTKFTGSKYYKQGMSEEEEIKAQINYVWDTEFKTKEVQTYYIMHTKSGIIPGAVEAGQRLGIFDSVEDAISSDEPDKAVAYFQIGYERPGQYHKEREDWAKQANAFFNKKGIKADKSKWDFAENKADDKGIDSSSSSSSDDSTECVPADGDSSSGGAADWGNDGKGTHKYTGSWVAWTKENLPDDLKKYALDPSSVGLKWGSGEGWNAQASTGGQCTDFAASFMKAIWKKDGQPMHMSNGNGGWVADNWATAFGGKTSHSPKKGAVASSLPGHNGAGGYGHVYVVSHVFADGSVLLVEQNIRGYSGDENGTPRTWSYRMLSKSAASEEVYYYPGDVGAKHNDSLKTVG